MAPIHTFLTPGMLFSSSKSWKQIHDVEADLCLNETIHKGWQALTLRAGETSDSAQRVIVLLRKLLRLSWLTYRDIHRSSAFGTVENATHTQD